MGQRENNDPKNLVAATSQEYFLREELLWKRSEPALNGSPMVDLRMYNLNKLKKNIKEALKGYFLTSYLEFQHQEQGLDQN